MTDITIPDIVLRTTSDDGRGYYAHGLVYGTGERVDLAVSSLEFEARQRAERIARGRATADQGHDRWYEVADVRLACDPQAMPGEFASQLPERWVAYGTLRSTRQEPGGGG